MLGFEGRVKRLGTERGFVARESAGIHESHGAEASNVAIVNGASVGEADSDRGVTELDRWQAAIVEKQRSGETGLDDDPVTGGQVQNHELRTPPASSDC